MPIANDTEDDVLYTIGDPGDPLPLAKGCYRADSMLGKGAVVRFWLGTEELASSAPLNGADSLVVLKRDWQTYEIRVLAEQA